MIQKVFWQLEEQTKELKNLLLFCNCNNLQQKLLYQLFPRSFYHEKKESSFLSFSSRKFRLWNDTRPERDVSHTNSQDVTFLIKQRRRATVERDNEPARFMVSTFVFLDSSGIPIPPEAQSFLTDTIARVTARAAVEGSSSSSSTRPNHLTRGKSSRWWR